MTSVVRGQERALDPRIERTRDLAVSAAVDLIAKEGLEGCTMQNVSRHTRISRSTLYRHWPRPEDLQLEALETIASPPIAGEPDTGSLAGDLRELAESLVRALSETDWGRVAPQLFAGAAVNDGMSVVLQRFIGARMAVARIVLDRARARGEVTSEVTVEDVAGLLMGPIYYRHVIARVPIDHDWVDTHADRVVRLVETVPSPERKERSS